MAGLVVKALVFPQQLQQSDAPGGEQAVCADDDQQHRQKIERHRHHGVVHEDGDGVAAAQRRRADDGQQPAGAGLPLAGLAAPEELDGVGQAHPAQIQQQGQQQKAAEQRRRHGHGGGGHSRPEGDGEPEQPDEDHGGQPVEGNAAQDAARDADEGGVKALPALEPGNVALAHAEDVVKAQFLFPLLHQEAVDIQHQHGGQDGRHHKAKAHHVGDELRAPQLLHALIHGQGGHDVKGGGQPHEGQQVGQVKPAVLPEVLGGKPGIEGVTQGSHLRRQGG